jgi:hypothetical protein
MITSITIVSVQFESGQMVGTFNIANKGEPDILVTLRRALPRPEAMGGAYQMLWVQMKDLARDLSEWRGQFPVSLQAAEQQSWLA